jgi:hypothetical protein
LGKVGQDMKHRSKLKTSKVERMTKPSRSTKQEQLPEEPKVEQAKTPDPPCASCGGTGFVDEGIYVPSLKPCGCRS